MENRGEKRGRASRAYPAPGPAPVLVPALAAPLALQVILMIPPPSIAGPWGQMSREGRRHILQMASKACGARHGDTHPVCGPARPPWGSDTNQDLSGFQPYGFRTIITLREGVTCSDLD